VPDDWRNALADEPTTADVLDRLQPKSWWHERSEREMPTLQSYLRSQQGGMLTKEQLAAAPSRTEPNAIGRAMSYIPEDVMLAANFLGPKVPMPPRIANPIRAYHGSPHDFDRFDLSKIGTGEGAQAYGHGLYFAESEPVAKGYRDKLSRSSAPDLIFSNNAEEMARGYLALHEGDKQKALIDLGGSGTTPGSTLAKVKDEARHLIESGTVDSPGRMYEVALHATPESFLDWDKPLSGQSTPLRDAFWQRYQDEAKRTGYNANTPIYPSGKLREHMDALERAAGSSDAAAGALKEIAPGLRYRDALSRDKAFTVELADPKGAKYAENHFSVEDVAKAYAQKKAAEGFGTNIRENGTRNYVVWSPEIIEILRKYGIAGPAVVGGGVAVNGLAGDQQ